MSSYSDSYKAAGVDVTAGYRAVELMKKHVARTVTSGVLDTIGGFGGLNWISPVSKSRCWYPVPTVSAPNSRSRF